MRTPSLRSVASAFLLLISAKSAIAQSVRGVVVDSAGRPVAGVVVQLLDAASVVRGRALSDDQGRFLVATPMGGTFRVQTLRIGFRAVISESVVLAVGQEIPKNFQLAGLPSRLDTVRVGGRSECGRASEGAAATAAAWEQVRAAITATELSAQTRGFVTTSVNYKRRLDEFGWRILGQYAEVSTVSAAQPWAAPNPESLDRLGYIAVGSDSTSYRAPGMAMLGSTMFIDHHCFRLVGGRKREELGISFEPASSRRDVPEIRGTIFVDRKSSELRAMEFRYVHREVPDLADGARGSFEFARLRNGTWTISKWEIRMPLKEIRLARDGPRVPYVSGAETKVVTTGVRVEGGELALARINNDTLWARPPLVLRGEVRDSVTGRVIAGARVALSGAGQETITDERGQFRVNDVLPGEYTLAVRTPSLDSLGLANETPLSITDGSESARVRVPDAQMLVAAICGTKRVRTAIPGILRGMVVTLADGAPPAGTKVSVEWTDAASGAPRSAALPTDEAGGFRMCGLPVRTPLVVRAVADTLGAEPVTIALRPEQPYENVRVPLDRRNVVAAVLSGLVMGDSGRTPVADAEIIIPGAAISTHSNERGAFRLRDVPLGTHRVLVRKMGYGPLETTLTFAADTTLDRQIILSRVSVLNEVVITARDRALAEFDDHRRLGVGKFMTRDFLETQEGRRLGDVFQAIPGVRVWLDRGGRAASAVGASYIASSRMCHPVTRFALNGEPMPNCSPCYAEVWLDDVNMTLGGRQRFDINSIDVRSIEAVEYYRGATETPQRYLMRESPCGTVVIHTRMARK